MRYLVGRVASRWLEARDIWLDQVFSGVIPKGKFAGRMDFQAVFMMGPPGAGKSYVKGLKYLKHTGFKDIDSDKYKEMHPDYDPDAPYKVHQWSLQEQIRQVRKVLPTGQPFVYDGTGWDPNPVLARMKEARAAGYRIFLVYVYVPWEISITRNRLRNRFVPEDVIIKKAKLVAESFKVLKQYADKFKVVPNFTDKQLSEAKEYVAMYPPPMKQRPPRPGDPDYGVGVRSAFGPRVGRGVLSPRNFV